MLLFIFSFVCLLVLLRVAFLCFPSMDQVVLDERGSGGDLTQNPGYQISQATDDVSSSAEFGLGRGKPGG